MSTDTYTNGDTAVPKMPTAAASFSAPGPPKRRTSRYDTKISHISSEIVSRGSHVHQKPHALRAHSGPLINPFSPKTTTSSAADTPRRSAAGLPLNRYQTLATHQTAMPQYIPAHDATWK